MKHFCSLLIFLHITHRGTAKAHNTHRRTAKDDAVTLQIDPFKIWEGDILNLTCRYKYRNSQIKEFAFYKDSIRIHSEMLKKRDAVYRIKVNSWKHSGSYHCTIHNKISRSVTVDVYELFSKPKLRTVPAVEVFEGQQLEFSCIIEPMPHIIGLQYSFYKNGKALNLNSYYKYNRIEAATLMDSGTYLCEVNALKRGVKKKSDEFSISVKEVFSKPTLRAEYEAQLFEGQQMILACLVDIIDSSSSLRYGFYKDGQALNSAADNNYYIKETSGPDDSGIYWCEATTLNSEVKKLSNEVSVSVRRIPVSKPELAISPGKELIEEDTASLTCSVSNGSFPITYIFYKDPNIELYREKSDLNEITYQIGKVNRNTKGDYSCGVANEAAEPHLISKFVAVSVIVPVADASLTSNINKSEISAGDRLVLQCLVKRGTAPHFRWYLNNQQIQSTSESYHLNTDGSELIINSFQIGHGGRYHCVSTNRGTYERIFNTTSNYINVTIPAQSHTTAITASFLTLFLIAPLIALIFFKLRKKKQDNSSSISEPPGEATGNGSQTPSEETSASNLEYAVVGSARNTASNSDEVTYSVLPGTKPMEGMYRFVTWLKGFVYLVGLDNYCEVSDCLDTVRNYPDDTKTAAEIIYTEVMIKKSRGNDNVGGASGGKQDEKNDPSDYYIIYATVNRANTEAISEGDPMEELVGWDTNVYANFPRK